jgi:hypothetical protein
MTKKVVKQTGNRFRRTSLGKDVQMAPDSVDDSAVVPTIKIPPFEYN